MRIVFMGTPSFAVESLKALHESPAHQVVAVVTSVDKPAGRGRKLNQSAVKEYALKEGLSLLQPEKLKEDSFLDALKKLNADLFVVVAFRMLPKVVWSMPKYGTFNLHSSLLPDYRGAAPINWAIVNGEKKTGVSTFFINEDIDTGEILLQKETAIAPDEDAGSLHDRLMLLGADLVLETADGLEAGKLKARAQPDVEHVKDAPKIFKEDLELDLQKNTLEIYNHIRGMSPFPGAWASVIIKGELKTLKIYASAIRNSKPAMETGEIAVLGKQEIVLALKDGALCLKALQIEGKRRMNSQDFINGRFFEDGAKIHQNTKNQ